MLTASLKAERGLKVDGGRNEFRPLVDQVDHVDSLNLPLVEARLLIRLVRLIRDDLSREDE